MILSNHLFKGKLPLMNRALDAYALRQQTIAKNIANATSPNYRPERVKFEEFFNEQSAALPGSRTDGLHIPLGKSRAADVVGEKENRPIPRPEVYFSGDTHVNIDREMSELAQNQIRYRFTSRMINKFFGGLSNAITGSSK